MATAPHLRIERLTREYDRRGFRSGVEPLDRYLREVAMQEAGRGIAQPYVATPGERTIAGYYSLCQTSLSRDSATSSLAGLTRHALIPATLVARLAVDLNFRSQGVGRLLLVDALDRVYRASSEVASAVVLVDAKDDSAANFYRRFGFERLPGDKTRLFLPMATIAGKRER